MIEVTSNSTEDYDRGEKLNHYKQCHSLKAALFVSHRRAQVTVVARNGAGWEQREYRAGEQVEASEPHATVAVDELYRGIELERA